LHTGEIPATDERREAWPGKASDYLQSSLCIAHVEVGYCLA